jgi:hypothetical protein
MLHVENKSIRGHYPLVSDSLIFLQERCSELELALWDSVSSCALPWPLNELYPEMPQVDGLNVDYVIIYFRYKTIGVALCFWSQFPPIHVPPLAASSTEDEETSTSEA